MLGPSMDQHPRWLQLQHQLISQQLDVESINSMKKMVDSSDFALQQLLRYPSMAVDLLANSHFDYSFNQLNTDLSNASDLDSQKRVLRQYRNYQLLSLIHI